MKADPNLHIIVAMTASGLIGADGQLPWALPEDLDLFRQQTMGHNVIMGRKTYESIGRPLDGRTNIVISSKVIPDNAIKIFSSFEAGLLYATSTEQQTFCIGGREIYRQALSRAGHLHISWVNGCFDGDTFFPDWDQTIWLETEQNQYPGFTRSSYVRQK